MATKTRNFSLTTEMDTFIMQRVRSGFYGNASDVLRACMRALVREELGSTWREWQDIAAKLPQDPITPDIEADIESRIRALRRTDKRKAGK
ncbi:MAG: type II toxin-antitoxin system ParD family antitoxin [Limisphaerales bacterium]